MFDKLVSDPIRLSLSIVSSLSILLGVYQGLSTDKFKPDKEQSEIEKLKASHELRKLEITVANDRFDQGCEGVFYLKQNGKEYQPLTKNEGVYSGAFWKRWKLSKGTIKPAKTDYLAAGTSVCDAYGNTAILRMRGKPYAVADEMANTPDRDRINKMMSRYPNSTRPQVGS